MAIGSIMCHASRIKRGNEYHNGVKGERMRGCGGDGFGAGPGTTVLVGGRGRRFRKTATSL